MVQKKGTIFISYAHTEEGFINHLKKELDTDDFEFNIWTDHQISKSKNWVHEIDNAIKSCFAVIVIITPNSMDSPYVTYEWSVAMGYGLNIITVLLQKSEVHPKLHQIQYLDFLDFGWDWEELKTTIRSVHDQYRPTEIAGTRTLRLLEEGRRALAASNLPDALQSLETALHHAEDSLKDNIYYEIALVHLARKDTEQAEKALKEAIKHKPDHVQSLVQLGTLHRKQAGNAETDDEREDLLSKAESEFREVLKTQHDLLDRDGESVWGSLGGVLKRRNRIDDAIVAYKNAAAVKRSSYPYNNLGLLYLEKGKQFVAHIEQAFTLVELFTRTKLLFDPSDEWVHNDNFIAKIVLGKTGEAESALTTLLILAPDYALKSLLDTFKILIESDAVEPEIKSYVEYAEKKINIRLDELETVLA